MTSTIRWTSSKRGAVQHAYVGESVVGFLTRKNSPLGPMWEVTQMTDRGNKSLGSVGGGSAKDAQARARKWLQDLVTATAK